MMSGEISFQIQNRVSADAFQQEMVTGNSDNEVSAMEFASK